MPPVEIQWCDHSAVLLEYLRQLYDEGRFVDVGLECEGRQVKAHKAVISACSPYLEGLLKGNPARSHLIKFNGYSYNSLRAVIDFMYNGKVMVEQDQLAAFLKLGRALQVRGILDIAAQCEEAGLTTAEETKCKLPTSLQGPANAQYSTTVQQQQQQQQQQNQKIAQAQQLSKTVPSTTATETKKYAFMVEKGPANSKKVPAQQYRKVMPNVIGPVDSASNINKVTSIGAAQVAQQQAQQQVQQIPPQTQQQTQQQQLVQQAAAAVAEDQTQQQATTTIEELQQALASGQAILQTDPSGGDQLLQMGDGQCVVTGSGQTYVVVQEGDNISFVPAEMVQGDLQAAVNGGQVMEALDPVEQQLAQMEGQDANNSNTPVTTTTAAVVTGTGDSGTSDTMSVVESLVKLGEKQPCEDNTVTTTEDSTEVGADMPCLDGADLMETGGEAQVVGPDMPDLGGDEGGDDEEKRKANDPNLIKRKLDMASQGAGRGKKLKN